MLPRYLIADVDDTFTVGGQIHPAVLAATAQATAAGIAAIFVRGEDGTGYPIAIYADAKRTKLVGAYGVTY